MLSNVHERCHPDQRSQLPSTAGPAFLHKPTVKITLTQYNIITIIPTQKLTLTLTLNLTLLTLLTPIDPMEEDFVESEGYSQF